MGLSRAESTGLPEAESAGLPRADSAGLPKADSAGLRQGGVGGVVEDGVEGEVGELGAGALGHAGVAVFAAPRRVGRLAGLRALRSGGRGLGLGPRGVGRRRAGAVAQRGRPPGFGGQPGQLRRPFPGGDGGRGQPRPVGFEGLGPCVQLGDAGVGGLGPGGGLRAPHRRGVGGVGQLADRRAPVPPRPHAGQEVAVAVQPGRQPFEIGRAHVRRPGELGPHLGGGVLVDHRRVGRHDELDPGCDAVGRDRGGGSDGHHGARQQPGGGELGAGPGGIGGVVEQHATDQVRQPLDHSVRASAGSIAR